MGWWGDQSYRATLPANSAAALVAMAEHYFVSIQQTTSIEIRGDFETQFSVGNNLNSVWRPELHEMQGIVFPHAYDCEGTPQPISFTFCRPKFDEQRDLWSLINPKLLQPISDWSDKSIPSNQNSHGPWTFLSPGSRFEIDGTRYESGWPELSNRVELGLMLAEFGCEVNVRKGHPYALTLFLAAATTMIRDGIMCSPNPIKEIESESFHNAKFHFEKCLSELSSTPAKRITYWGDAFGCA